MGEILKDSEESNTEEQEKKILETALKRFSFGLEQDSENRNLAIEDMKFRAGDQWPDDVKNQRKRESRPFLTINKIPGNIHQITNDQRQNRPAIRVEPIDDVADPETAKVLQGIIRNIENNSNADTVYDVAFDSAVTGGRGFFRVLTDYSDPYSFNQDIKIKGIKDPHCVVLDPTYKEPDGSDANWGFCFEDISKEDFEASYPDAKCSGESFDWGDVGGEWHGEHTVRVAEYFEKIFTEDTLVLLPDDSTILKSELDKYSEEELSQYNLSGELVAELVKNKSTSRKTMAPKVMWYKICGNEILESTEWPCRWIPIIPVHGEELIVDGKRVFEGLVRHAKDPQRMYNYWATCETESIALAPKAPYIGAEGQFEGHEAKWRTAHLKNYPYLEYKPTVLSNGQMAPQPQRNFGEPNVQAITQARMLASDDLKSTTSIYDASVGNRSNETSGVAINRRTMQSQTGNFHFIDNLSRSIRHLGRIIVDLIPKIYDTERTIRIIGPDDEQEIVAINSVFHNEKGKRKKHDTSIGKYDVSVTTGPSYASKRQEAVESMLALSSRNPQIAQFAGDLLVKNMDWPGAQEIAERLKKTIPKNILGEEESEVPAQVQAQIEQMNQVIEQMSAELDQEKRKSEMKLIELESKERIEMAKLENDLRIKSAELEVKEGATPQELAILAREILQLNDRMEALNFNAPIIPINENNQDFNNPPGGMSPELTGEPPMDGV